MSNLAIKRTIDYAKKFGGNLTEDQLHKRLLSNKIHKREDIRKLLQTSNYALRTEKNELWEDKLKKVRELADILGKEFEDIEMIGVTGSVAAGYPDIDDDIDLMIITKKDSLWLTRLRLRYYIWKQGIPHRKFNRPQNKDEFCFNLWVDECQMKIPKNRQNIRNAVDLIMMIPVLDKENAYQRFIAENDWAKKWVATGYQNIISNYKFSHKGTSYRSQISKKNKNTNIVKQILNLICFVGQVGYMAVKLKVDEVGLRKAFFHPRR